MNRLISLVVIALVVFSCSQETGPVKEPGRESRPSPQAATPPPDERRAELGRKLFGRVMDPLGEVVQALDRHENLKKETWFGTDQGDNLAQINKILDQVVEVLSAGELDRVRGELRDLEEEITGLEKQLLAYREARVSAPREEELNALEGVFKRSRGKLDRKIARAQEQLAACREKVRRLEGEFLQEMKAIGLEMDLESARSLLSTVTGDDFIRMCLVFDNVRGITLQLQKLTEASGESLEAARRYYGTYLALVKLMDRVQKEFIQRTREKVIPRLEELAVKARELIAQARRNMAQGGNQRIGRQNISANELTLKAIGYYTQYLRAQAGEVQARNRALQVDMRDAVNTYKTVSLSSQVAALMRESSRNFAALLELDLPRLRGFDNKQLRAEFKRLTRQVGGS